MNSQSSTSNPAGNPIIGSAGSVRAAVRRQRDERNNFEALASKLVRVPKAEIDEKRQKS